MGNGARILMYAQDSFGLGHLRRTTNLANSLVRRREDLSVLLVVDSPVAPFFELEPRIDFVKLPTVVKVDAGVFRTGRLLTEYEPIRKMRAKLILEITRHFDPHVLLVDHMPGGANRELYPTLGMIRRRRLGTKLVLGLRDIIDAPSVTRSVWGRERVYHAMKRYYDRVLIYGAQDVFATTKEYRIDEVMGDRVRYCGYVCNMAPVKDPRRVREKLGLADDPIVAVMAGGGADAFHLMNTYLEAARIVARRHRFASLVVTGPFMPEEKRKKLRNRAKELGVAVRSTASDALSQMNAADVLVSMAGYNTLTEILRFGKRAVVVPRSGPSAEQSMRARLFAQRGLIDVLDPSTVDASHLAEAIGSALANPPGLRRIPPGLDGVANATDALLEALPAGSTRPERARSRRRGVPAAGQAWARSTNAG